MERPTLLDTTAPAGLNYGLPATTLHAREQDRFYVTAVAALRTCRPMTLSDGLVFFRDQLTEPLRSWCADRPTLIAACYLSASSEQVKIFVVTKSSRFDFDLMNELGDLEMRLHRFGWRTCVLQLPMTLDGDHGALFNLAEALRIYGDGGSAPGEGVAK